MASDRFADDTRAAGFVAPGPADQTAGVLNRHAAVHRHN